MAKEKEAEVDLKDILASLSPLEKKILPFLRLGNLKRISEQTELDLVSVRRAFQFLANKNLVVLQTKITKFLELDTNGILYKKKGLPERRLLIVLLEKKFLELKEAKKVSDLSDNEFTIALGVLKEKGFVNVQSGRISLVAGKEQITKQLPEEKFLETLPLDIEKLDEEQLSIYNKLKTRKALVRVSRETEINFEITDLGSKVVEMPKARYEFLEQLTPEMMKKGSWKGKQFRKYDLTSRAPAIIGGRSHFYYSFLQEVREKLVALGFEEITGPYVVSEFWNFDALFQPQFHVAREWSDSYGVKNKVNFRIDKRILDRVRKIHEAKWNYRWDREKAMHPILRPEGTVLSAQTLGNLFKNLKVPGKYFALARCFRPDVIDATHLTEFNQLEGIVVGKNLNLRHLLGLLKLFAKEIVDADEVKFLPDYFPFTEPSVELSVKKDGRWLECGGSGIFRNELVWPLAPEAKKENIKVLAWGIGVDRLAMLKYNIQDIRELFSRKLEFLRTVEVK